MEALNWQNKEWMQFFNNNRYLWEPVASEWGRLSKQYLTNKNYEKEKENNKKRIRHTEIYKNVPH